MIKQHRETDMEQLDQALAEILNKAASSAEKAGAFVMGELPEVAQQVVLFGIVSNAMIALFAFLFGATAAYFVRWCYLNIKCAIDRGMSVAVLSVISCTASAIGLAYALDAIKAWLTPKVYLLEYAANLVRSAS